MSTSPVSSPIRENVVTTPVEMCTVRIGDTRSGLPISHILEIVTTARPQPVPLASSFVGGLVHYRGDVLTTVSLRRILGMPDIDRPQPILVLESPGGCFGVLVDEVGEVMTVSPEDYEPNPSTLDDRRKGLFTGTYKLRSGLLVALDPSFLDPLHLSAAQTA